MLNEFIEQHEIRISDLYVTLAQIVRDRALKAGIHDVGGLVTAHRNNGNLSKFIPPTRLRRNKHTTDGLYHYELYYMVRDIRFIIPFAVMFKKEAKPTVEQIKKLCGMVYYDYYGTFYGRESDELLFQRT